VRILKLANEPSGIDQRGCALGVGATAYEDREAKDNRRHKMPTAREINHST